MANVWAHLHTAGRVWSLTRLHHRSPDASLSTRIMISVASRRLFFSNQAPLKARWASVVIRHDCILRAFQTDQISSVAHRRARMPALEGRTMAHSNGNGSAAAAAVVGSV